MGIEKALVQVYDEDGCVTGWALNVTGMTGDIVVNGVYNGGLTLMGDFFTVSDMFSMQRVEIPNATPIEVLPAGTVATAARVDAFTTNGTDTSFLAFSLITLPSGQNIVTGSETTRIDLLADGSVTVTRTAGTLPITITLRIMWL